MGGAIEKPKKKRPGIHSKNASRTKGKNNRGYKKPYRGQGKRR